MSVVSNNFLPISTPQIIIYFLSNLGAKMSFKAFHSQKVFELFLPFLSFTPMSNTILREIIL